LKQLRLKVTKELDDSIFDQRKGGVDDGGWARRLYSELSEYEHARPNFRNADLWKSNGPVFSPSAFGQLVAKFFETAALCFLGENGEITVLIAAKGSWNMVLKSHSTFSNCRPMP